MEDNEGLTFTIVLFVHNFVVHGDVGIEEGQDKKVG
jgi:hypothetical protein